jgi:hypothetical protein
MLCVASLLLPIDRPGAAARGPGFDIRDYEIGGSGRVVVATDLRFRVKSKRHPLRYRTQTSLHLKSALDSQSSHIEIISNDLFFALKLEPISHFPGMNHLLLARDAGMRLERP